MGRRNRKSEFIGKAGSGITHMLSPVAAMRRSESWRGSEMDGGCAGFVGLQVCRFAIVSGNRSRNEEEKSIASEN